MKNNLLFDFSVNKESKTITVKKEFEAPLSLVWDAFTKTEMLDNWWAPKPWKAKTKTMDFREGGFWLYAMVGPKGEEHWSLIKYTKIQNQKYYEGIDGFCDATGKINTDLPQSKWKIEFKTKGEITLVENTIFYKDLNQLETIINMGFKEGYSMTLSELDHYLKTQIKMRKELKTSNKARVSSYLNFDGKTEEAFLFYKSVFKTEFLGKGIERFGDIPASAGHPAIAEEINKMVLHVQLPITGNHILMGTDAPKEMGFTLKKGNNMHICIEPETRKEADRLFNELSVGGNITMPLADMFFGAYFGEFSDKFGINWMINFIEK